ncbi:hypothetical protein [Streptomyces sp. IB201691-2A2]|uniref:hypothetical protein n=1 Tax=Streptomyces sp. IB201691-2A2 TaxID=2561920 RepID=UPI0021B09616|nr:hypothetical protein [Streptomyces sp. IB201691-2A2]
MPHHRKRPLSSRSVPGPGRPSGVRRVKAKTAETVAPPKPHSVAEADPALGTAAVTARFADQDLLSLVDHQATHEHTGPVHRSEEHSRHPPD